MIFFSSRTHRHYPALAYTSSFGHPSCTKISLRSRNSQYPESSSIIFYFLPCYPTPSLAVFSQSYLLLFCFPIPHNFLPYTQESPVFNPSSLRTPTIEHRFTKRFLHSPHSSWIKTLKRAFPCFKASNHSSNPFTFTFHD